MSKEQWKEVYDYDGIYAVSSFGRVVSFEKEKPSKSGSIALHPERIMKQSISSFGYNRIGLVKNGKRKVYAVHRLVAKAFIGLAGSKMQVNHKDGNKLNNHVENLEWVLPSENIQHAIETGLTNNLLENHHNAKLRNADIETIRKLIANGESLIEISNQFNVKPSTISKIKTGRTWAKI